MFALYGTHNRAGEITYRLVGFMTYEVTITTYTNTNTPVDRCELEIDWGDNTTSILNRINGGPSFSCANIGEEIEDGIRKNIYRGRHTYSSVGTYRISMLDRNRNAGVLNITNSVNEAFYLESTLVIDPILGPNNSPTLLNPPTDFGCVGLPYTHSLAAFDQDGDSLSYKLVDVKGNAGTPIISTYTSGNNLSLLTISVDRFGTITWDKPERAGLYNFAVEVTEHRKLPDGSRQAIGKILRDIQLEVGTCDNKIPEIRSADKVCVVAGERIEFPVIFSDPNLEDKLALYAYGGPLLFDDSPAVFDKRASQVPNPYTGGLAWQTTLAHIRDLPYDITFKVVDSGAVSRSDLGKNKTSKTQHGGDDDQDAPTKIIRLSKTKVMTIQVLPPAPTLDSARQQGSQERVRVYWQPYIDKDNIEGYYVYRSENIADIRIADTCATGLTQSASYLPIDTIEDPNVTIYEDRNGNSPFRKGTEYIYRIVAYYKDGGESIASNPESVQLINNAPIFVQNSIDRTSISSGEVRIRWRKPDTITTDNKSSLGYVLSKEREEGGFQTIRTLFNLTDTTFVESSVNTFEQSHRYQIELADVSVSTPQIVAFGNRSSSPFLSLAPLNKAIEISYQVDAPWVQDSIRIERETETELVFEDVLTTTETTYTDQGLENGQQYCYRIQTYGHYTHLPDQIITNQSQIACATPEDNVVECVPQTTSSFDCFMNSYSISWSDVTTECDDVIGYIVVGFASSEDDVVAVPIDTVETTILTYAFEPDQLTYPCYGVVAIDEKGNVSETDQKHCTVPCGEIRFPNIFTPNGDGANDFFIPLGVSDVEQMEIHIYDRWGRLVYETSKLSVEWDGSHIDGGQAQEGVYYYFCTLLRQGGEEAPVTQSVEGYVHLVR